MPRNAEASTGKLVSKLEDGSAADGVLPWNCWGGEAQDTAPWGVLCVHCERVKNIYSTSSNKGSFQLLLRVCSVGVTTAQDVV